MNTEGHRTNGMKTAFRIIAVLLAVVLTAVFTTGCSSSKKKTSTPSTTASSSSPAQAGGDEAAIRAVYTTLVNPGGTIDQKLALLQDGAEFRSAVEALAALPQAKEVSVQVTKVVVNSANLATVTYSVLLSGSPILTNLTGHAIRDNGTWKLAGETFCGLLAANQQTPPVCSKPAATSLPS